MGIWSWIFGTKSDPHAYANKLSSCSHGIKHHLRLAENYKRKGNLRHAQQHYQTVKHLCSDLDSARSGLLRSLQKKRETITQIKSLESRKQTLQKR